MANSSYTESIYKNTEAHKIKYYIVFFLNCQCFKFDENVTEEFSIYIMIPLRLITMSKM